MRILRINSYFLGEKNENLSIINCTFRIINPFGTSLICHGERWRSRLTRLASKRKAEPEIVKWVGEIRDDASTHTTEHVHNLEFVRQNDGSSYDIVESPELVKLHHETEKNFLVEIEAEITSRFLFWGGNLVVKKFKVLQETSEALPHKMAMYRVHNASFRDHK